MKFTLPAILLFLSVCAKAQTQPFHISTSHLTDNIYVCTSWGLLDDKTSFPANGLFVVTKAGVILIDTPWDEAQTQQLIDILKQRYHQKIVLCIATHSHSDR